MSSAMENSISNQRGLTLISWMVVIVFLLFQGIIAMNVLPVYLTDSTVATIMEKLPDDANAKKASTKELKRMVSKRLNINSVYSIDDKYIKVKKGRGEKIVVIEYEPRGKLVGSLDYIVSFRHEARIQSR